MTHTDYTATAVDAFSVPLTERARAAFMAEEAKRDADRAAALRREQEARSHSLRRALLDWLNVYADERDVHTSADAKEARATVDGLTFVSQATNKGGEHFRFVTQCARCGGEVLHDITNSGGALARIGYILSLDETVHGGDCTRVDDAEEGEP